MNYKGFAPELIAWLEANGVDHNRMPLWAPVKYTASGPEVGTAFVEVEYILMLPTDDEHWPHGRPVIHIEDTITERRVEPVTTKPDQVVLTILDGHARMIADRHEVEVAKRAAERIGRYLAAVEAEKARLLRRIEELETAEKANLAHRW